MRFFNIGCDETQNPAKTRSYITSAEPLKEGIWGSSFRHIAKTVIKVVAATLSFASVGPAHFACSTGSENYTDSDQSSSQNQSVTKTSKTDDNGKAVFNANGRTYEINLYDRDSGEPVAGINIIFSIKGEGGFYIILYSSGIYVPKLAGLGAEMDEKTDSTATKKVSNVVMHKGGGICQSPAGFFSTIDLSSKEGMMKLDEWHEEWIKAKKNNQPIPKNPLTENFESTPKDVVTLSELNDKIKYLLGAAGGEGATILTEVAVVYLGLKKFVPYLGGAGLVLMVSDVCAISEKLDWAAYYKALCHEDSEKFEIWRWKSGGKDVGEVYQNPIFLVLPVESKHNWAPPMAGITGKVIYTDPVDQFYGLFYSEVQLKHIDGKFPTIKSETPLFYPGIPEVNFSFGASACENINPTYDLSVNTVWANDEDDMPKITLTVEEGKPYTVTFMVKKHCFTGYTSESEGSENYVVFCKGYPPPQDDCDGFSVDSGCSYVGVKPNFGVDEIFGCLSLDKVDNIYFCGTFDSKQQLSSLDKDLNLRWSIEMNCPVQPSLSSSGTTYLFDIFNNVYSISGNGSINWIKDVDDWGLFTLTGRLAVSTDGTTYVGSPNASVLSVKSNGDLNWVYTPFTLTFGSTPSIVLGRNEKIYVMYSPPMNELIALDNKGNEEWSIVIPTFSLSSFNSAIDFSVSKDGRMFFPSQDGFYTITEDGEMSEMKIGASPFYLPVFDEIGNLYTSIDESVVSFSPSGEIRWSFYVVGDATLPTITKNGTVYFSDSERTYAVDAVGEKIWATDQRSICPVNIGEDGTVYGIYYGSFTYRVAAISWEGMAPLANSSWPMFRHDPQNSGNAGAPIK